MNTLLGGFLLGLASDFNGGGSTRALSAAATWQAFSIVGNGKTLDTLSLWQTAKTGSPVAADIELCLCADNGGVPNHGTIIESKTVSSIPASSGRLVFSGWSSTLSDGVQYWVFVRNLNATPASNFVTIGCILSSVLSSPRYAAAAGHGWGVVATVNSGTAWATNAAFRTSALLVKYSDASHEGLPFRGSLRSDQVSSTYRIYSNRAHGCKFNGLDSGITYNVSAASFVLQRIGTITSVSCKVYDGSGALVATSRAVAGSQLVTASSGSAILFEFSSVVGLTASGGAYRFVVEVAGGDASNYVQLGWLQLFDTGSDVAGLMPQGGTWCHTYTQDNTAGPISWTDAADEIPLGVVVVDSASSAGASGIIRNGGMRGGLF